MKRPNRPARSLFATLEARDDSAPRGSKPPGITRQAPFRPATRLCWDYRVALIRRSVIAGRTQWAPVTVGKRNNAPGGLSGCIPELCDACGAVVYCTLCLIRRSTGLYEVLGSRETAVPFVRDQVDEGSVHSSHTEIG